MDFPELAAERTMIDMSQEALRMARQIIEKYDHVPKPHLADPLDRLEAELSSNAGIEAVSASRRRELFDELSTLVGDTLPRVEPFPPGTKGDFGELYDESLPTLGLNIDSSFSGSSLLGLAASRRRAEGRPSINIAYLPAHQPLDFVRRDGRQKATYYSRTPLFMNTDASLGYSTSYRPCRIDVLEDIAAPDHRRAFQTKKGIPGLTSHSVYEQSKLHEKLLVAQEAGVAVPKGLCLDAVGIKNLDLFRDQIAQLPKNGIVVVKPQNGRQGNGVRMFNAADFDAIHEHATAIQSEGEGVMIEEFIEPVKYIDPDTGAEKDWNVRVITVRGETIGMFARVGNAGGPINYAQGARIITLEACLEQLKADETERAAIRDRLFAASDSIAQVYNDAITGIDLTADADGKVYAFEVNTGIPGGLEDLIELPPTLEEKIAVADKVLDILVPYVTDCAERNNSRPRLWNMPRLTPRDPHAILAASLDVARHGRPELLTDIRKALDKYNIGKLERKYLELQFGWAVLDLISETKEDYKPIIQFAVRGLKQDPFENNWYGLALTACARAGDTAHAVEVLKMAQKHYPVSDKFIMNYLGETFVADGAGRTYEEGWRLWQWLDNDLMRNGITHLWASLAADPVTDAPKIAPPVAEFMKHVFDWKTTDDIKAAIVAHEAMVAETYSDPDFAKSINVSRTRALGDFLASYVAPDVTDQFLDKAEFDPDGHAAYQGVCMYIEDSYGAYPHPRDDRQRGLVIRACVETGNYTTAIEEFGRFQDRADGRVGTAAQRIIREVCESGDQLDAMASALMESVAHGDYQAVLESVSLFENDVENKQSLHEGFLFLALAAAIRSGEELIITSLHEQLVEIDSDRLNGAIESYNAMVTAAASQ